MRSIIYVKFLLIFLLLIITSCKKHKYCPPFSPASLIDFAYQQPETITFKSTEGNIFKIFIEKIEQSESYSYTCRDLYRVCPCLNSVKAIATDTHIATSYIFLEMEQSDVSNMQYHKYNVKGFRFEFDYRNELPHIDEMPFLQFIGNLTIDNVTYSDVIRINNTSSTSGISQVFFSKKEGVLQFVEKGTNLTWSIEK